MEQICVQMLQKPAHALGYKPAVKHPLTWQDPTKSNMTKSAPTNLGPLPPALTWLL